MCCTAGWPIPVEKSRVIAIEESISRNVIPLRVEPWLLSGADAPEDVAGILAARDNGHCVFFEAGRPGCSIHDVKPAGCTHFPYLGLIDQRGVHVSLSHYCPTAASHSARVASAVIRTDVAARQCGMFRRPLDRELMIEAIRQSDLLLVHYADPAMLAATSSTDRPLR